METEPHQHAPPGKAPATPGIQSAAVVLEVCAFFREHYRDLVAAAMYVGASKPEAEDAVQQILIDVIGRWPEIQKKLPYTRQAVIRRIYKERKRDLSRTMNQVKAHSAQPVDGLDPELIIWEQRQWVDSMLAQLTPTQEQVMRLTLDGLKPRDIAVLLGKTPGAVSTSLRAAKARLQQEVEDDRQRHERDGDWT